MIYDIVLTAQKNNPRRNLNTFYVIVAMEDIFVFQVVKICLWVIFFPQREKSPSHGRVKRDQN